MDVKETIRLLEHIRDLAQHQLEVQSNIYQLLEAKNEADTEDESDIVERVEKVTRRKSPSMNRIDSGNTKPPEWVLPHGPKLMATNTPAERAKVYKDIALAEGKTLKSVHMAAWRYTNMIERQQAKQRLQTQ
jgi:hypothetical protein